MTDPDLMHLLDDETLCNNDRVSSSSCEGDEAKDVDFFFVAGLTHSMQG